MKIATTTGDFAFYCKTGTRYFINTGKDMREFIKYVDHPMIHGC